MESFRVQAKTLVWQDVKIQNETLHKNDGLFDALILKSSCANSVSEFIKRTPGKYFTN